MKIIVDTSVWSHALRRGVPSADPQALKLAEMLRENRPIVLLGVVIQEVLSGIKNASDFERVKGHIQPFPVLPLRRQDYISAARLANLCRSKGIGVSVVDAQIACACIEHDCALLTCDNDFAHIANVCPLQLA